MRVRDAKTVSNLLLPRSIILRRASADCGVYTCPIDSATRGCRCRAGGVAAAAVGVAAVVGVAAAAAAAAGGLRSTMTTSS